MSSRNSSLSAPFIVSVTGHRDIVETEALRIAFAKQLAKFKREAGTENCILLSGMAEGADTLAADVAAKVGWTVIAPLPLPRKDYRKDFENSELKRPDGAQTAQDEFDELLEKCQHFFIGWAPECTKDNTSYKGDGTDGKNEYRNRQYAYLGEFLTRHCEVLIAFWDGNDAAGIGGTGYVVNLQREGLAGYSIELRPDGILLDPPEVGRTFAIWSKREKHEENGIADGKTHGCSEELPHSADEKKKRGQTATKLTPRQQSRQQKREEQEKKQEIKRRQEQRAAWEKFVEEAKAANKKPEYQPLPLDLAKSSDYRTWMRDAFLRANELAGDYKKRTQFWFYLAMAIVLVFTLVIAGADAYVDSRWGTVLLLASWGLLASACGISQWQKHSKIGNRHQDYRALAEAWRVGFFWHALGIQTPLDLCYLRSQRGELDWIRQALRSADLGWRAQLASDDSSLKSQISLDESQRQTDENALAFASASEHWIADQAKFFSGKVPDYRIALTALRNWSWAFLVVGLVASALQALVTTKGSEVMSWSGAGQFMLNFASAKLLSSPLVPALLLVGRMREWPIATEENTKVVRAKSMEGKKKREKLRYWFVRQSATWTFLAIGGGLLTLAVAANVIVDILPIGDERARVLQLLATLCFFLPSLIFVAAEHNALPEEVVNYERMSAIFARAKEMLKQLDKNSEVEKRGWKDPENWDKARRIYRELGREALHENGEWLLIHRDRPLDVEL